MKTFILAFAIAVSSITNSCAQVTGNGKTITKNFDYKNFDKLNFIGFNDKIEVEIGEKFSIEVTMKTENEKYLQFEFNEKEHELTLRYKNTESYKEYKKGVNYQIKITMPEASVVTSSGNSDVTIDGIQGRYFRAVTTGNGDMVCNGSIDELDIEKVGNGDVNTKNVTAKKATIKSTGNGDVKVNVSNELTAKNTGNGDIINFGKASFDNASKNNGNGELIKK